MSTIRELLKNVELVHIADKVNGICHPECLVDKFMPVLKDNNYIQGHSIKLLSDYDITIDYYNCRKYMDHLAYKSYTEMKTKSNNLLEPILVKFINNSRSFELEAWIFWYCMTKAVDKIFTRIIIYRWWEKDFNRQLRSWRL